MSSIRNVAPAFVLFFTVAVVASAQDAAFTYQGELKQAGNPADGSFDMEFSIWDASVGGNQVNTGFTQDDVVVIAGKFSIELDFGSNAFDNSNRWLEIVVDGVTLTPRQRITRSPYSIQTRGIMVDETNNVGIGTTSPQRQLDLESSNESTIRLTTTDSNPATLSTLELKTVDSAGAFKPLGRIEFVDQNDTMKAFIQGTKTGTAALLDFSTTPGQSPQFSIGSELIHARADLLVDDGVGIGTLPLTAKLEVFQTGSNISAISGVSEGLGLEVAGVSGSGRRRGVIGRSTEFVGTGYGGYFESTNDSNHSAAVYARQTGVGTNYGVFAIQESTANANYGVWGESLSVNGIGVHGAASSTSGINYGVRGSSASADGFDFYASGAGMNYGSASSIRWKSNIELISDPLGKLSQIRGVYYDWDDEHGGQRDIGFVGEEVGKVLPEVVAFEANSEFVAGMDYSKLTPLLVEAVKELRAEKDTEIKQLKHQINELQRLVKQLSTNVSEQIK